MLYSRAMSNPAQTAPRISAEVRNRINDCVDVDVSREAYVDNVFRFPEVRYVELAKFTPGLNSAPLLQKIERGYNPPNGFDELILSTWKAGQYRMTARLIDGTIAAPRIFALGDPAEAAASVAPHANGAAAPRSADEVTVEQTVGDLAGFLKRNLNAEQLMDMVAQLQTRRMNREIEPMRLVMDAFDKLASRAGGGGSDKFVELLQAELKDLRQELRDERNRREERERAAVAAQPAPAATGIGSIVDTIRQAREAGLAVGMVERTAADAGAIAAAAAKDDPGALEIAERVLDKLGTNPILAPLANTLTRLLEYKLSGVLPTAPAALAAPEPGARPTTATPGGTMARDPRQEALIQAFKEAVSFFKASLQSEDFETCRWMLYNQFVYENGMPIVELNPKVPAGAYMIRLRQIDPEFASLEPQVRKFLEWAKDNAEQSAPASGDPHHPGA